MSRTVDQLLKRGVGTLFRAFTHPVPRSDLEHLAPRSILVVRQHNQLGDMLCIVPFLRALRKRYPQTEISLLASPVNYEVMLYNRYLDRVLVFDKREILSRKSLAEALSLAKSMRGLYDLVLVPATVSTSFTSDLLAFLTGAPARLGVEMLDGKRNPSAFFYTNPVALDWRSDEHRHQTLRNLDLLVPLGIESQDLAHEITLTKDEQAKGKSLADSLKASKPLLIGLHPGAGKPPNRWPARSFARLVELMSARRESSLFVTAGSMDRDVVGTLLPLLRGNVELLEKKPIREIASLLKYVDLYITNDTGLLHVAAAVGAPVIGLFGPTDPLQWAPVGRNIRYIQGEGGDISTIAPEAVLAACLGLLTEGAKSDSGNSAD